MGKTVCKAKELDPETSRRRNELFQKYIVPYYNMIYFLVKKYSYCYENVEENYNETLMNLYRGVETYDPSRPIKTWIHIVVKRHVFDLERKRLKRMKNDNVHDVDGFEETTASPDAPTFRTMDTDNFRELYSDEVLEVLDMLKPIHRDAIILQEAGYSLKEIADIEYRKGTLKSHNIETVKSRLYLARQFMKKYLTRDGKRKLD